MQSLLDTPVILQQLALFPLTPNQRIFWVYLLGAFLVGFGAMAYQYKKANRPFSLKQYIHHVVSPQVYFHRSSRHDVIFFLLNGTLQVFTLLAWFRWVQPTLSQQVQWLLFQYAPTLDGVVHLPFLVQLVAYTLTTFVVLDFAIYLAHWMQHRWPLLWAFHQTHHSAQVLQPLTVYRVHMIDNLVNYGMVALFLGIVTGLFQYLSATPLTPINTSGINLFTFLFYILGYNLRHTHIWVNYGPQVSQWLISPAQHQIHHSNNPRHFDKNMGLALAIWDRMFGTLYIPTDEEAKEIEYGIDNTQQAHYTSIQALFIRPFVDAAQWTQNALKNPRLNLRFWKQAAGTALVLCLCIGMLAMAQQQKLHPVPQPPSSVYLENLTWPEVKSALDQGTRKVIIPTGGTEQNGIHMILGKHNQIVTYTAGRIAQTVGQTLVAPTIAYVPEGSIEPPDQHMRYPGTISLPVQTFKVVLESTARSLKAHGFTRIYFLGDSGWNQQPQEEVAETLNRQWNSENVRVYSVSPYYYYGGEQWLNEQGFMSTAIGTHAGIRDTSELMAVNPSGIRTNELLDTPDIKQHGSNGRPKLANKTLGQFLIEQKIQRGARFIRHH